METINIIMRTAKEGSEELGDNGWYQPATAYAREVSNALFLIETGAAVMLPQDVTIKGFNSISLFERQQWLRGDIRYAA